MCSQWPHRRSSRMQASSQTATTICVQQSIGASLRTRAVRPASHKLVVQVQVCWQRRFESEGELALYGRVHASGGLPYIAQCKRMHGLYSTQPDDDLSYKEGREAHAWWTNLAKQPRSLPLLLHTPFSGCAGMVPAMATCCQELSVLLDKSHVSATTFNSLSAVLQLYCRAVAAWPGGGTLQEGFINNPVFASAAAPIIAACLALLRHQPAPAAAAPAAAPAADQRLAAGQGAAQSEACCAGKQRVAEAARAVIYAVHIAMDEKTVIPDAEAHALMSSTVLGSSDMWQLLLAGLALNVGCFWHKLGRGRQSVLQAPAGVSSMALSAGQPLVSVPVAPSHLHLLQALGVVLPELQPGTDSVLDAAHQPRLSTAGNVSVPSRCLQLLSHAGRTLLPDWSPGSSVSLHWLATRPDVLSTPVLCTLVPVLLELQLLLNARQILITDFSVIRALSHFTEVLHDRCRNPVGSCSS